MEASEKGHMTSAGAQWDRDNVEQGELIYGSKWDELLVQATVRLKENLQLEDLWAHLEALGVLKRTNIETIMHNRSRPECVEELVKFIRTGGCQWQYHALMRAMALTGQRQLIPGTNAASVYYPEKCQTSECQQDAFSLSQQVLRVVRDHCKSKIDSLMKIPLFDFMGDADDDITDISKLLVPVDLKMKDNHGKMVVIPTTDILEQLCGKVPPRVVRLYGDPGDGKTSIMKHIAHCWSAEFLKLTDEKLSSKCPRWTTIVYLSARNIKGTVKEAIRDELGCKESDADTLMNHVATGDGTAVLMDSLDEVRDKKVLEKIKHYIGQRKKKGGPTVLIASRTGLCPIDPTDIDRTIKVQGFTEAQGLDYVKQYTEMCKVQQQPDQPALVEYVTQHREKLRSVLTNPLRLYIFCTLAVLGELDLANETVFNIPNLFGTLERYLLRRDLLRREESEVTDDQRRDFYRLCMHGLLNGLREFPESLLAKFNIAKAYYIFLTRSSRRGPDGAPIAYYSFSHEVLYEYFASRYIHSLTTDQKKSLLLSICSKEELRNVQYIIFQMLLEEWEAQKDLIASMVRCMLILQFSIPHNQVRGNFIYLMSLRYAVMKNPSLEGLLNEKQQDSNSAKIWEEVNSFEKNADRLRESGWFVYIYMSDTLEHVIRCLQASSAQQQEALFESTICHMMPFKWNSTNMEHFHSGPAIWGDLPMFPDGIHFIFVTCPREATKALLQYRKKHAQEVISKVYISFNECGPLGTAPDAAWTQAEWYGLTQELTAVDTLEIRATTNTPLTGMFRNFAENMAHLRDHITQIDVEDGRVPLDDLLCSLIKSKQVPTLSFKLCGMHVVVPNGEDEAILRAQRDRLCGMINNWPLDGSVRMMNRPVLNCAHWMNLPILTDSYWITESGQEYVWSDHK